MAQAEKTLQNRILTYLNFFDPCSIAYEIFNGGVPACVKFGKIIYKSKGRFRFNGFPDVVWTWNGVTRFIETKTPTGKLSKEQKLIHAKLKECGAEVLVIRSFQEMIDYNADSSRV